VRLMGGPSACEGRVEILHNGEWGTVCGSSWDLVDANTVCKQLGCGTATSFIPTSATFGPGVGRVWMDDVACTASSPSLALCTFPEWGTTSFQCAAHALDVGVTCSQRPTPSTSPCACGLSNGPTCVKKDLPECKPCATETTVTTTTTTTTTTMAAITQGNAGAKRERSGPRASGTSNTMTGDPHLTFAHGGTADFKGDHLTWYNMLSASNISLNVLFVHDDFRNPNKLVHGSAMKAAAWTLRSNVTGRMVTVEFNSSSSSVSSHALVHVSGSKVGVWAGHGRPFRFENILVELKERKQLGVGKHGSWHGMALVVSTGKWQTTVWNHAFPNAKENPGKSLLNVHIEPQYNADADPVAPHGLVGQSYDGDGQGVNGATDDYSTREVTTSAMAEGALEGLASDYKMANKFDVDFRFARFNLIAAKPRDVSKLTGSKPLPKPGEPISMAAGAAADVED